MQLFSIQNAQRHSWQRLAMGSLLLAIPLTLTAPAHAQVAIQANPAFSTPTPAPQNIAPPPKPFKGDAVELDLSEPAPDAAARHLPEDFVKNPEQKIKITDIELNGNRFYSTWVVRRALKGLVRATRQPVSYQQIDQEIKRINKFNNFKLKATIRQSGLSGDEALLHLDVYEQQPFQITGTFDNQGRPAVGTLRPAVQLTDDSLLGMGDQLKVSYLNTRRDKRAAVDYKLPLNRFGGAFGFHYDYQFLDYGRTIDTKNAFNPNLTASNHYWEATVEQPLDKNRVWTPYFTLGIRHITNKNGSVITTDPDNRTLAYGVRFNKTDHLGSTAIDVNSMHGVKQLGGDFKFWRFRTTGNRVFNLPHKNKLILKAAVQLTPDFLPPPAEMQLGGAYSVRGYTEGLIIGDRAQYYGVEHQWPVPFLGKISPYLADRIRLVDFIDFAQVRMDRSNPRYVDGFSNKRNRTTLMSAGVGVRAQLTQYAQGFCDFGFGFGNRNNIELNTNPAFRVHFGLRSDFLPKPFKTRPHGAPRKVKLAHSGH